ncbi:LysR family transcriptional regulator [Spiractinospora alimapuensis]|uniref:LysR family transcriptional regulator n=1 Tax=Spiractinospora alimapuensis TaxID=2820884 RepID=UPI001F444BFE|nr:LysR family transcriptional regulator [Spiractinospora alimapuensis]QVQ53473.1 LysR family transcriptional regulator [Spiractinospora alimapuensis]
MELRQLRYFAAVAERGGFARAAEWLHVGQPAVSQQVRRLERELGVALFDRSTRHVRLTSAGTRLLPEARAVLATAERTTQVAAELAGISASTLRLATGAGPGDLFYALLEHARRHAPDVQVRLTKTSVDDRLTGVRHGSLDAALVRDQHERPDLELIPIWSDPLVVALPSTHPLAHAEAVDLADLGGLPLRLALRRNNVAFHRLVHEALARAGVAPPAGPLFTRLQDTLSDIAQSAPSWTLFYPVGPPPTIPGIAYFSLPDVHSTVQLAVRPGPPAAPLRGFVAACALWSRPD